MKRKKVLLTGATGNMGLEGLKQLYANKDKYHIIVFALPTERDKKILKQYDHNDSVSIAWGDLTNYEEVKHAVDAADIVLHVGALVSPMADHQPELAWKVNYEGTKNIVDAILARPDKDHVKLMYTGTVAETGNRAAPYHWGRIGDPLVPSVFDYYALSKIAAERYVIESGLKNWVSLRQTGIMHDNLLSVNDGIGYHMPLDNYMEWTTAKDSGRILLNICADEVPGDFWGKVYNIGGGETCRWRAHQFLDQAYGMLGVDYRDFEEPNWYATRNFHGQWFYDSDVLNEYLDFRSERVDDVFQRIAKKLPFKMKLLKILPKKMVRKIMRKEALKGDTPLNWVSNGKQDRVNAFFGSLQKWESISSWDQLDVKPNQAHKLCDHGYDEGKTQDKLTLTDVRKAAIFRGGLCLSKTMNPGDLQSKLAWKCAHGHDFEASPYLVLKTGHWCPECMKTPWNFDEQAKFNPFLGQVWFADHEFNENRSYV